MGYVIVMFGAGVYAKKYKAILEYLEMGFDYFTDNDAHKWGTTYYGKPVIAPVELTRMDCKIIISCTHEDAIGQQLCEMGIRDRVIELRELCFLCMQKEPCRKRLNYDAKDPFIIVDMYEGIGWGGSEIWAAQLAYELWKCRKQVCLLGSTEQPSLEERYEKMTERFSCENTIAKIADFIEAKLPCTFINNFAGCAFLAASIVKKKYPDKVKIISVIHSDKKNLMDAHMMLKEYIDKIFCVSNQIKETVQNEYDFDCEQIFFKEQMIRTEQKSEKEDRTHGVLKIGYAARLVKQAKRADLLPELIKYLEEKKIKYLFQIAGWGECGEDIADYLKKNNLEGRVKLLGRIPKSKMGDFWKNQDIVINISEYEGSSLSMLEAMAYGCVPVVTDVSGAREFIRHGENGFICDIGDLKQMALYIYELSLDWDRLNAYGAICRKMIQEKCNPEEYMKYWLETLI